MGDYAKLLGLRVISIKEGILCGKVIDFLVDYAAFKICALIVRGGWNEEAEIVPFEDVESIGPDAVMIPSSSVIKPVKKVPAAHKAVKERIDVSKLEVITRTGHAVGKIATFEFDPATGKITAFEIAGSVLKSIFEGKNVIPVKQIVSIGKDAMIIHDKKEQAAKPAKKEEKAPETKKRTSAAAKKSTKSSGESTPKKEKKEKKKTPGTKKK